MRKHIKMKFDKTPYAKIFDSEKFGQILVAVNEDSDDGQASIEINFRLPELGINKACLNFTDEDYDVAYKRAYEAFEHLTLDMVEGTVQNVFDSLSDVYDAMEEA